MTGSATLTGRFSAAVGTACEASKTKPPYVFTDVIVDRLWVPFSPCGHRAPVFPSIASGYAIPVWPPIPALPVTLRIASPCQLPASRPAPPVHPRKGERQGKNPFLFAMLFEKNIETFFERQPFAAICLSLPPPAFPRVEARGGPGGWKLATGCC